MALIASAGLLVVGAPGLGLTSLAGAAAQEPPTLSLTPSKGGAGKTVTARGTGYCHSEPVTLWWDDDDRLARGEADQAGRISLTFTVPRGEKGQHTVVSRSRCGGATAHFTVVTLHSAETVTPPPKPPPNPASPNPASPNPASPLPAGPPAPPQPNEERVPPDTRGDSLDQYKDILKRELEAGVILYNPPERMKVGVPNRVEVRISRELSEGLSSGLEGSGRPRIEDLQVGTLMRARLEGGGFEIAEIGSHVQQLADVGFREWRWEVTPTESGNQSLFFVVSVLYKDELIEEKVFERRVDVAVNPSYSSWRWLSGNWQGLIAAVVGLVGIAEAYRRLRRRGGR